MSPNPLFLGIDLGTSSLKCGLFDLSGACAGLVRVAYATKESAGQARHDAGDWWRACLAGIRAAMGAADGARVVAISIGGHAPSPVFVDSELQPVAPVIPWFDLSATLDHERLLERLGGPPSRGPDRLFLQVAARAAWMRRERPDSYLKVAGVFHSGDYLATRLTGRWFTTTPVARELLAAAGLPERWVPIDYNAPGDVIGPISPGLRDVLGLNESTLVVAGGLDSFLGSLGSGMCRPDDACLNSGSSAVVSLFAPSHPDRRFDWAGGVILSRPLRVGARILDWVHQIAGGQESWIALVERAAGSRLAMPPSNPLLPILLDVGAEDSVVRDELKSLASIHDSTTVCRMALDALFLCERFAVRDLEASARPARRIRAAGRLAASPAVSQLQADIVEARIEIPTITDTGAVGAAIVAAVSLGFHTPRQAADQMVRIDRIHDPMPERRGIYARVADRPLESGQGVFRHPNSDGKRARASENTATNASRGADPQMTEGNEVSRGIVAPSSENATPWSVGTGCGPTLPAVVRRRADHSRALSERARRVIWKGGKESTRHEALLACGFPAFVAGGEGCEIWDVDGNRYTDYLMSWGTVLLGHCHPVVEERVRAQLGCGSQLNLAVEAEVNLAERLISALPGADMLRFLTTGAEATAAAVRIARAATGREKVARYGFHGWLDWCQDAHPAGIPKSTLEDILEIEYNDLAVVRGLFELHPESIACVIMEPIKDVSPEDGFLRGMRDLVHEFGALLIFDEAKTGFRFGAGGAQGYYGVAPDLSVFSKAIANGFPLSVVAGEAELFDRASAAWVSGTYHGWPPSIAAAHATLDVLEREPVVEHVSSLGRLLMAGFNRIMLERGMKTRLTGAPPMPQIDTPAAESNVMRAVIADMLDRGHFIHPIRPLFLSFAHDRQSIDRTLDDLEIAVRQVKPC